MGTRRSFLANTSLAAGTFFLPGSSFAQSGRRFRRLPEQIHALEQANGGRVGFFVLDPATGEQAGYRATEHFPMCSTFKFLLAAAVLKRVDDGAMALDRHLRVPDRPLLGHSPLTEPHAGATMSVADVCQATLIQSDNTAANMLLELLGGPSTITAFARSLGDGETRLDRTEPSLNTSLNGDPRDTTTPSAMAQDLKQILLGKQLHPASRQRITEWMENCATGLERLRKNLPGGWRAADKTGSNGEHTTNDIAVLWPARRAPVVVTAYITQRIGPEEKRGAMIAEIGRYVREAILLG